MPKTKQVDINEKIANGDLEDIKKVLQILTQKVESICEYHHKTSQIINTNNERFLSNMKNLGGRIEALEKAKEDEVDDGK